MQERSINIAERKALAYEQRFDVTAYQNLLTQDQIPQEEFQRRMLQLDLRTRHNLETEIGERLNVEISRITYRLTDGKLQSDEHDEPFEEIIERGRQYRLRNGNPFDLQREEAELTGFQRAQKLLSEGARNVIIISPPGDKGSDYKFKFGDFYINENGIVTMSRRALDLTYQEFFETAKNIDPALPVPIKLSDVYFLSHPLTSDLPMDQVVQKFQKDKKTLSYESFQKVKGNKDLIDIANKYIEALKTGAPETKVNEIYKAYINLADELAGLNESSAPSNLLFINIEAKITHYGNQKERKVDTACPSAGGPDDSYSVADYAYGFDSKGTRKIHCETCGVTYQRNLEGKEEKCRFCGGTKGIAC